MKRLICCLILFSFLIQPLFADTIVTKENRKIKGKILKRVKNKLVIRTSDGSATLVPVKSIVKIYRGNKVLDFETKTSYYVEKRRPYMPFMVLGAVSTAYSVNRFKEYNRLHEVAQSELTDANSGTQNTHDTTTPMAMGIVSSLFSIGCFYIAFKPMEVKVPIGKLNVSATPYGMTLALQF